jgi:hypothetical protein
MPENNDVPSVVETVDLSLLRPRRPFVVVASTVVGAVVGVVYGVFAHRAETAFIPVDLLLFGALGGVVAWLLDITKIRNSSL